MDKRISQPTREEVLRKLRRRYETAGAAHKRKLLDQAQELLGYRVTPFWHNDTCSRVTVTFGARGVIGAIIRV